MEATTLNKVTSGQPNLILVLTAADLREAVTSIARQQYQAAEAQAQAERETPTMTRHEVALKLGITLSTLWKWGKDGYLCPVKIGSRTMYRPNDVDRILQIRGGNAPATA